MNRDFRVKTLAFAILSWILILLLNGCGSKQSPTGGKEDVQKLRLLASLPEEFDNLDELEIELTFDKSVDRASFLSGFYIYPPVQNKKIYYESNVITIRFLEALNRDTNYYLTLSTRIKDVRGNALDTNQTLVFRHGILQNHKVSGLISYEKAADNGLPVQFSLTAPDSLLVLNREIKGSSYSLEALNPLEYRLRAYIDKNLNGRYDPQQEPFTEKLVPNQPLTSIELIMAYADTVRPAIKTVKAVSNREYEIVMNKPVIGFKTVRIRDAAANENIRIFTVNHELDTIHLLTAKTDSTELEFIITDAADSKGNTTEESRLKSRSSTAPDLTPPSVVQSSPRNGSSVSSLEPILEVQFSEVIPSDNFHASLTEVETRRVIPLRVLQSNSRKYRLQPGKTLTNYKTCLLVIESKTADLSGNKLGEDFKLSFLPLIREGQKASQGK